jgi:hypothetical protein
LFLPPNIFAKVQYACSANYLNSVDVLNFTPEQQGFLKDIPDPMFRVTIPSMVARATMC